MARAIAARPDLASALLQVKGRGELTTTAYRGALKAFLESGHEVTVDGFAAYIHKLRQRRSAATVNHPWLPAARHFFKPPRGSASQRKRSRSFGGPWEKSPR